jgi:transposase InsO family protein
VCGAQQRPSTRAATTSRKRLSLHLGITDIAILAAYAIAVLGIGFILRGRVSGDADIVLLRTLLRNPVGQIVAADFFVVPTATYRLLFVLVLLAHDRRRIRHVAVTAHPTAAWTPQQLREAFPWDEAARYLLHDRDHAFDSLQATAKGMGIEEVLTAPRAPWQNPFVERFIGAARRDCFDHVIVFNEAGLLRLMARYWCKQKACLGSRAQSAPWPKRSLAESR